MRLVKLDVQCLCVLRGKMVAANRITISFRYQFVMPVMDVALRFHQMEVYALPCKDDATVHSMIEACV